MTMKTKAAVTLLFVVAALYDGLLGLAFLSSGDALYARFGVAPPNHPGYVQFPAALLLVFALMFAAVAANPARNRNLIPYGVLLKLSYCGVVAHHWLAGRLPWMWKPFCIVDLAFAVLFVLAWAALRGGPAADEPRAG